MKIKRTKLGARLIQGGAVLSEIRATPGPTHSVFDVLAAAIAAHGNPARIALLGFAGGGIVAPLRAMKATSAIDAVDLDMTGADLFREIVGAWCGEVEITEQDAVSWLRRSKRRWDTIVEDLSTLGDEGETKPVVSVTAIPELIARRLRPNGCAIINLLPVPGVSWRRLTQQVIAPWRHASIIHLDDFENRIVITGPNVRSGREVARDLKRALESIGSDVADGFRIRTFPTARRD